MDPKNIATWVAHAYVLRELVALEGDQSAETIVAYHAADMALRAAETALRCAVLGASPPRQYPTMGDVDVAAARLVQAAGVPGCGCGGYGADYAPVVTPEHW